MCIIAHGQPWSFYGALIAAYGRTMVHPWVISWCSHGASVDHAMASLWSCRTNAMVGHGLWLAMGHAMNTPLSFHGRSRSTMGHATVPPWSCHGHAMGMPWPPVDVQYTHQGGSIWSQVHPPRSHDTEARTSYAECPPFGIMFNWMTAIVHRVRVRSCFTSPMVL